MSHIKWMVFSGAIWFAIGISLLSLGMKWIVSISTGTEHSSLITAASSIAGNREQGALLLIVIGLMIGFLKGKYVLSKTVQRMVQRIVSLPAPARLSQVYGVGYLGLILVMMLLGMGLRWLHVPLDIRGVIDIAVGSALMNGALNYFRSAWHLRQQTVNK